MKLARWLMSALMLSVLLLLALGIVCAPDKPVAMLAARWATPPSRFLALVGMQVHLRDEGPRYDPALALTCYGLALELFQRKLGEGDRPAVSAAGAGESRR